MSKSDTPRTDAPEIIYLQTGGMDEEHFGHPLFDFEQVTWCRDKQYDSDIKYVRADKTETELAAANVALQAISQQEGWREIESAPKDGSRIIGLLKSGRAVTIRSHKCTDHQPNGKRWDMWCEEESGAHMPREPIGWMPIPPLPAPPTQSKGE